MDCHTERSEGSAVSPAPTRKQILRFAQDDKTILVLADGIFAA
jgi:hypothetical protein